MYDRTDLVLVALATLGPSGPTAIGRHLGKYNNSNASPSAWIHPAIQKLHDRGLIVRGFDEKSRVVYQLTEVGHASVPSALTNILRVGAEAKAHVTEAHAEFYQSIPLKVGNLYTCGGCPLGRAMVASYEEGHCVFGWNNPVPDNSNPNEWDVYRPGPQCPAFKNATSRKPVQIFVHVYVAKEG